MDPDDLTRLIAGLLADETRLADMGLSAAELAPADPCEQILADMRQMGVLD